MRISRNEAMINIAIQISERSTCMRRKVGCVLTDSFGRILSVGHNGVPMGHAHCIETPCLGFDMPTGTGLHICASIHAEQNALMFCNDIMGIDSCYTTTSPCITCIKMLLNTSCKIIYFKENYIQTEAKSLWENSGGEWILLS